MNTAWLTNPEARAALAKMGGAEAASQDPAGFVEVLGNLIENSQDVARLEAHQLFGAIGGDEGALRNPTEFLRLLDELDERARQEALIVFLSRRGLTVGQLVDMRGEVAMSEPQAELTDKHGNMGVTSAPARQAVSTLYARGLEPDMVARVLDLDPGAVLTYLNRRQAHAQERVVLALHFDGLSPTAIAKKLNVIRQTAANIIRRHGETPHHQTNDGALVRQRCVELYRDGRYSYSEIMRRTGAKRSQLRNALVGAAERGELPEYGMRRAGTSRDVEIDERPVLEPS